MYRYAYKGEMLTVREICDRTGLGPSTIRMRIKDGVPLDAPWGRQPKLFQFGVEMLPIKVIASRIGLHTSGAWDRVKRGKPLTDERYRQHRNS